MNKTEVENRIRLYKQQLQLFTRYKDDLLKTMSKRELYDLIDETLDRLKKDIENLKKIENK